MIPPHVPNAVSPWLTVRRHDFEPLKAIAELAAEYEAVAAAVERFNVIRKRAYQIWEEQGRPDGLHADHWHDAELQVAEDERNEGEDPAPRKP